MSGAARGGGAAMAGGQRFQAQVTAWWGARILLQTPIGHPFDLPAIAIAERIYSETTDSVDDIRLELSGQERIFGQCKRSLSLSNKSDSVWASVLIQFFEELKRTPIDKIERRFVLFYEKPNGNLEKLKAVLNRYRSLPDGSLLTDAAPSKADQDISNDVNTILDALQAKPEYSALVTLREVLLRHIYIKQLRLGAGESDHLGIADALQEGLLTNPTQTVQTITSLHRLADDLLADRGSTDRFSLRRRLQGEGIGLRDTVNFRADFERLDSWSNTEIATHEAEGRLKLSIRDRFVIVEREVVKTMLDAVVEQKASFIVVGPAGMGKTGCLLSLASQLKESGQRVWYWAADSLPYHSPQEIATHLNVQHSWVGILAEAASGEGAILIVDGLDGLRDSRAQQAYRKLFALAIRCGIKVIASIRSFDLQYAIDLQEIFPSTGLIIPAQCQSPSFRKLNHILVLDLTQDEYIQIFTKLPEVLEVLVGAPQLTEVVNNLFSLDLLCKLISDGEETSHLSSISTQAELFERYWLRRVSSHSLHHEMTETLRRLIEQMTDEYSLQVIPKELWAGDVKTALFSTGLVRHPASAPDRLAEERLVEFNHHLLFDYAAELLLVRPRRAKLAEELAVTDTWGLFLRPSLVLFHLHVWRKGRNDFWDTLIELERASVSILHKLPGHLVVAEHAHKREDLQPLLTGSLRLDEDKEYWVKTGQGIISAAAFSSLPRIFSRGEGDWWIEFARDLILTQEPQLAHEGQWILLTASRYLESLSTQSRLLFNQAAVALWHFYVSKQARPSPALRSVIEWICLTINSDPVASFEIIRGAITGEELQRSGYIQAYALADQFDLIWKVNPALAVEIYEAVFGYVEIDESDTSLDNSLIFSLTSNKKQDYELSYHLLASKFGCFMSAHPKEATQAVIQVIRHYSNQEHQVDSDAQQKETFIWSGRVCHLHFDFSYRWDVHAYNEYPKEILHRWEEHLVALPSKENASLKWDMIQEVLITENELAAVWRRLLIAATHAPAFYAPRLQTMLLNPEILSGVDTGEAAGDCIEAFAPHLGDEKLHEIEQAILSIGQQHFVSVSEDYIEDRIAYTKVKLLCRVPELRRGDSANEYLAGCDQELLELCQSASSRSSGHPSFSDYWPSQGGEEGADAQNRELLRSTDFLIHLTSKDVTDETLPGILHEIHNIESSVTEKLDNIDQDLARKIDDRIIHSFSIIAASKIIIDEQLRDELFQRFRLVLTSPAKAPSMEHLEGFDKEPNEYSSDTRAIAAKAFINLTLKVEVLPSEWKEILRRLADDPEPVIRASVGRRIWAFLKAWPEFVWETLERWIIELPVRVGTQGVLKLSLYNSWFWWLRKNDVMHADRFLQDLWTAAHPKLASDLRTNCGEWVAALWFMKEEKWAEEKLKEALKTPAAHFDELRGAQTVALERLFPKPEAQPVPLEQQQLAAEFLTQLLISAKQTLETYWSEQSKTSQDDGTIEHPPWTKQFARIFDRVAMGFKFSSKDYRKELDKLTSEEAIQQVENWWRLVERLVDAILAWPHPRIAFYMIEAVENLVDFDIRRGLFWLRKATLASAPYGMANEPQAADHTIRMLEQILAEHRVSLKAGSELRSDFVQILEAYLQVGWPSAMKLAIQLQGIYRG